MQFDHTQYTLGFRQALEYGIEYREYEKDDSRPRAIPLSAFIDGQKLQHSQIN